MSGNYVSVEGWFIHPKLRGEVFRRTGLGGSMRPPPTPGSASPEAS
jgi:hypothetical protein